MPDSPITTGGFQSPVMPQVNFANPAFFGGLGQNILSGAQAGIGMQGNVQRQKLLAAMAPIQQQQARLDVEKTQRELLPPVLADVGASTQMVPRPDGSGQSDLYVIHHRRNLQTGEDLQIPELKSTAEDIAKEGALAKFYGQHGEYFGGMAAFGGRGNKPYVGTGSDGQPHWFRDERDPSTGTIVSIEGAAAPQAAADIALKGAQAGHQTAMANRETRMPVSEFQQRQDAIAGRDVGLDGNEVRELRSTPEGRAAFLKLKAAMAQAAKAGTVGGNVVNLDPQTDAIVSAAIARARTAAPSVSTGIGVSVPGMGAPSAPQTGAPAAPAATSAPQNIPTVTTQEQWDALEPRSQYIGEDGQTYTKGNGVAK